MNKLTKEECEKAKKDLIEAYENANIYNVKAMRELLKNGIDVFCDLIKEHFEQKENTSEFKHFKMYGESTLKQMKKDELIGYIKILYHNWGVSDEKCGNIMKINEELTNIKPYKFEDLKEEMHVYDIKFDDIILVAYTTENTKKFEQKVYYWSFKECALRSIKFEKNRFFSVQKANEVLNNG